MDGKAVQSVLLEGYIYSPLELFFHISSHYNQKLLWVFFGFNEIEKHKDVHNCEVEYGINKIWTPCVCIQPLLMPLKPFRLIRVHVCVLKCQYKFSSFVKVCYRTLVNKQVRETDVEKIRARYCFVIKTVSLVFSRLLSTLK